MATKKAASKAPAANAANAADVLGQLADMVAPVAKPKPGQKQRWELPLTPEAEENFNRWIESKIIFDVVKTRMDNSKDELTEYCLGYIADQLFKNRSRPNNPELKSKKGNHTDSTAIFQLQDRFKYRFPEVPEGVSVREHFITVFVNLGLHRNDAERLVDNEIDFNPIVGLANLSDLLQGTMGKNREWVEATPEQKEAGRKLAAFLMGQPDKDGQVTVEALTPQELALIVKRSPSIAVKAGFYDRVATYCQNADQLKAIFKVIVPIAFPSSPKFAINDTPEEQGRRKIKAAADILGVEVSEVA